MPKFYGQNKKRIDPRYFLEETVDRNSQNARLAPGAVKSDVLLSQTMTDFSKKKGKNKERISKKGKGKRREKRRIMNKNTA